MSKATDRQVRAAMEALGCRPAGDCKCCEDYCVDHWVSFDENGLCPDARKVADAVEATHEVPDDE